MESIAAKYVEDFYGRGQETAYVHRRGYRTSRWTYREVAEGAARFARELEARGIGRGHRVLLWGENCAEWVVAFLGCMVRGAIVVPMDRIASPEFVARVCRQVEARLCLCSQELSRGTPGVPILTLETLSESTSRHSSAAYLASGSTSEDVVQIVFTSGTTADPKGVVLTHRNFRANLEPLEREIRRYLRYERPFHPLRFLNLLPLSHVFGQFLGVFVPQILGATVIFQDTLNPSEIIRNIRRERVSVLVAVPRMLDSLLGKIERDLEGAGELAQFQEKFREAEGEHFLRRWWRFRKIHRQFGWKFWAFISGGAALDEKTEQFWGRLGFAVIQGYGLTETTSLVSVNHPFKPGRGSIGKVLPGREVKLAQDGEILVRGENIASAYLHGDEARPVAGDGGWFHTGDVGQLDGDGTLYFKGRRKNVIVTPEGMNVFPEDLESALRLQPEVRECVVVGLEIGGNAVPCAVLIPKEPGMDPAPVVGRANQSLAEFQQMRHWFVWPGEDFPRTSTQKPRLSFIRDTVQARILGNAGIPRTDAALSGLISRITGRPCEQLTPTSNLASDLHLSSIERVELMGALEDRFQIDLDETGFSDATTVGELERMLRQPVTGDSGHRYPRWAQSPPVAALRFVIYYLLSWPATMLMARPEIRGRDKLRGVKGPLLIVSNHITQVDVGFLLPAFPLRIRHRLAVAMWGELLRDMRHPPESLGFVKRRLEQLSYYLVVALFNVFPLPQQSGYRESFAFAGDCADRGYSILVFPEGRRTPDGKMSPFRAGIGILARDLNLPVVPMRIDGLFELKQLGRKMAPRGAVTVGIGAPVRFDRETAPEEIAADLQRRVAEL